MLVRILGLKEYAEVHALQIELVRRRLRGEIPDTLLLLEHFPVYTIGRSSKATAPPGLPYPLRRVERGGDMTYHGPGQLVGYPILHLGELRLRPRSYLRSLEAVLIEALRGLQIEPQSLRGFTGLWLDGRKITSLGIAVKDQISYHGFALNVSCDMAPFGLINPCNLESNQMASLESLLKRPVPLEAVQEAVAQAFLRYFKPMTPAAALNRALTRPYRELTNS